MTTVKQSPISKSANRSLGKMYSLEEILATAEGRPAKADVSNANYLMGDVVDDAGPYGDVSTALLDTWNTLIGDVSDEDEAPTYGAPVRKKKTHKPLPKWVKPVAIGVGAGGAGYLTAKLIESAKRKAAQKKALGQAMSTAANMNTIERQVEARRMMGKVPRTARMPFYQMTGATLNQYPLDPSSYFAANDMKWMMDKQAIETPFESEIASGVFAGTTFTVTLNGAVDPRYYVGVLLTIGISTLTANPGTIFTVAGTFPLANGSSLVVSTTPWSFTLNSGWHARGFFVPWALVTNRPYVQLGRYSNANPIVLTVQGLPSNATVNGIVPGPAHVWTIGVRNALI